MAMLAKWTDTASRSPGCVVAIADIDDFKCINDRFGHDTGDAALTHVATMLQSLADRGWLVARIGGEELLLAVPAPIAPCLFAERKEAMRASLSATALITPAGSHTITASSGMAERRAGEPLANLLSRADHAKETGRNGAEMAG